MQQLISLLHVEHTTFWTFRKNTPSRSSELVRRYKSNTYQKNYNDLIFIIVSLNIYELKNLTSSLVRLGNRKEIENEKTY